MKEGWLVTPTFKMPKGFELRDTVHGPIVYRGEKLVARFTTRANSVEIVKACFKELVDRFTARMNPLEIVKGSFEEEDQ